MPEATTDCNIDALHPLSGERIDKLGHEGPAHYCLYVSAHLQLGVNYTKGMSIFSSRKVGDWRANRQSEVTQKMLIFKYLVAKQGNQRGFASTCNKIKERVR